MSMKTFLEQPNEGCRAVCSIGLPGAGKSFTMLRALQYWMDHDTFEEYHLVLPQFEHEQNDSYGFLNDYKGNKVIKVYNSYHNKIAQDLLSNQYKKKDKNHKVFLAIDDSTSQSHNLMQSGDMIKIVTESRHARIHSWTIMHYGRGIIPPKVRTNLAFVFMYKLQASAIKEMFDSYIKIPDMKYDDFYEIVKEAVFNQKHGCLFIDCMNDKLNPYACRFMAALNEKYNGEDVNEERFTVGQEIELK